MSGLFTPAARRHIAQLMRALAARAGGLERRSRAQLRQRGWDRARIEAFLGVTPVACARLGSLAGFLEQVESSGRRLARLNVTPVEVVEALEEFGQLVAGALEGRFAPAREQLQMATRLTLNQAFFQVHESEVQAFFGLSRAEAEATDLEDLLDRLVAVLVQAVGASEGRLLLVAPPVQPRLARPQYIRHGTAGERLVLDPELRRRCGSFWSYPVGFEAVLQLGFPGPCPWLPREQGLLGAAAARCREALERARMQQEIRRLEAESRRAEEEERRRIGRELHDEAGQSMALLRLQLEMLERQAPDSLRGSLGEAREVAARTAVELRRIVAALSPAVLERLGLPAALRQLAARFGKMHAARVRLRIPPTGPALPRRVEEVVYRVAQECLHNIARHSQATHVNLYLRVADKRIRLSVEDNGAGFRADPAKGKPTSFGLAGMRERAALLGGTLTVRSAPGQGTLVTLELPLSAAPVGSNGKDSHSSG